MAAQVRWRWWHWFLYYPMLPLVIYAHYFWPGRINRPAESRREKMLGIWYLVLGPAWRQR